MTWSDILPLVDLVLFCFIEALIFVLFVFSAYRFYIHRRLFPSKGIPGPIKRGEKSWNNFLLTYGIVSVLVLQVINSLDALQCCKVLVSVINLVILLHLFLFNGWFKNAVIGLWNKVTEREEIW